MHMHQNEFTSPYYPTTSTRYADAIPISILPQSTSVQIFPRSASGSSSTPTGIPHPYTDIPCGPEYFEARRKAWLTPKQDRPNSNFNSSTSTISTSAFTRHPQSLSPEGYSSRQRISDLLSKPGAVESEDIWNKGLQTLWRGLVTGSRFKRPLPLDIVIKILYAGWIRDGTWPLGASIPDSPRNNTFILPQNHTSFHSQPSPKPSPNSIPRPINPPILLNGFNSARNQGSHKPQPRDELVDNELAAEEEEDEAGEGESHHPRDHDIHVV